MLNNLERDSFNVVDKADTPITLSEGININQQYEDLYTRDYDVDLEHNIMRDTTAKLNNLGYDLVAPHERYIKNLSYYLGHGMQMPGVYEQGKKELFQAIMEARIENPNDEDLKLLPGNEEELQMIKDKRTINRIVRKKLYDQSDYASWGKEILGGMASQFQDTPMIAYLATLPITGVAAGLLPTAAARIGLWVAEGAVGGFLIESTQQTKSRELIKKLDLTLANEEVRKDLMNAGFDPDNLNLTQDELDTRLLYSWASGALLGGTIAGVSEGASILLRNIMKGDAKTMDIIDDTYHKTTTLMQGPKMTSQQEIIKHVQKMAQAMDETQFGSPMFNKNYNTIEPIQDLDKALNEIEEKLLAENVKFSKKEKRNLKAIMEHHNYNVQTHNSVVNEKHLMLDDATGELNIKVTDVKEADIFANATKAQGFFNDILKQGKVKLSKLDAKYIKDRFKEIGVTDSKAYQASLPKDAEARRQKLLNDNARVRLITQLLEHKAKNEKTNIGRYMSMQRLATDFLEISFSRNVMPGNVSSTQRAIFNDFMVRLDDPKLHNIKWNKVDDFDMEKIVRELYGESTNDEVAALIAQKMRLALDDARTLSNHYGSNIGRLDNYMPQAHDQIKIGAISPEEWANFIINKLDKPRTAKALGMDERNFNPDGTLNAVGEKEILTRIKDIHDDIAMGNAREPFRFQAESASKKTSSDQMRYFFFKDADSYLAYSKQYGKNPIETLSKYFDHMSNDIAMMKVFGPSVTQNAKGILKFARDMDARIQGRKRPERAFERMYDHITGLDNIPDSHSASFFGKEVRAMLVTAQLGSAYLASLADLSYGYITRSINGMSNRDTVQNYVKFMAGNKAKAREARVVGMDIAEEIRAQTRIHGETFGNGPFQWMAQNLMKVSLLTPGTIAGRTAFKYEFQFHLRDIAKKSYNSLDDNIKFMYERYGITKADHEALSQTKLYTSTVDDKVNYLRIADIEDAEVKQKFYTYMFTETEAAVPSYMARSRSDMMRSHQPGTIAGETLRSVFLFKNFPMTVLYTQGARAVNTIAKHPGHMRYLYPLQGMIMTSTAGYLIMNARNIVQGEDTSTMNPKTLAMGIMYGGGLGIFGDLVLHDNTRYGQTPMGAALGPVFGLGNDIAGMIGLKRFQDALYRQEDITRNFGRDLVTFLDRYTPYNNLWYTRAATDRLIFDNLRKSLDPDYEERKRRLKNRLEKEGRSFFIDRDNFKIKRAPKIQLLDWKIHE